ncbi:MAG: DUF222 domain-containing protein [Nocardioides sp.]
MVEQVAQLRSVLAAVEAGAVAEVEARQVAKTRLGWASTADWVTHLGGLRRGQGRRVVRHAVALVGERGDTLAALAAGAVSVEQAGVIVDAVEQLPGAPLLRRRGEAHLLEQAGVFDATDLARTARHLVHVVDPDRSERRLEAGLEREERAAHVGRFLAITDDGAGGVRLKGRGSTEDGALLRAALLPLTRPQPTAPDSDSASDPGSDGLGSVGRDLRDHGARLWDALVGTAQHALDTALPPASHGTLPRVALTCDLADLRAGVGVAATDDGLELSVAAVRRLACDAGIVPVVLGTDSAVLDVGREQRLVTAAIWLALITATSTARSPAAPDPPDVPRPPHPPLGRPRPHQPGQPRPLCGHHHRLIHHTPGKSASPKTADPSSSPTPTPHPHPHLDPPPTTTRMTPTAATA